MSNVLDLVDHTFFRVERAAGKSGAHLGQYHHVEREHGLVVIGGGLFGEAAMKEVSGRRDVGEEIFRRHQRQVLQIVPDEGGIDLDRRIDEIDAGDLAGAVGRKIIRYYPPGIGPADQDGPVQTGGIDHGSCLRNWMAIC